MSSDISKAKYELSIAIPAREEEWLAKTVEDLLENTSDKTEILVGLDGYWPEPGLPDHARVRILHVDEPIGQRALQNRLVQMSSAKWVAKCDAHCAFDKDFDTKMLAVIEEDMTLVPLMRNLHVFDWVCDNCGMRTYQGPALSVCRNEICDTAEDTDGHKKLGHHKELVWQRKPGVRSTAYRFNKNLQFKYFPELRAKLPHEGLQETMSLQGSFFMCSREKYWGLKLCDESWGSWGQQGTEVALKTWLSGGRVLCHHDTWYAHLFRTQDGFSWPYGSPTTQGNARRVSQGIFLKDKWEQAIHPLSWLLEKFWFALKEVQDPEAKWEESDLKNYHPEPTKGILYFTDNELPLKIASPVQRRIRKIAKSKKMELVSSTRNATSKMGKNVVTREPRGVLTMFKQILKGLEAMTSDIVFMAEADVLYPPEHFDFTPTDKNTIYFDHNWYKVHLDGLVTHWDADQVSGMCAYRDQLIPYYKERIETYDKKTFDRKFEPYSGERSQSWWADIPYIDLRTGHNMTYEKRSIDDFRNKDAAVNFTTGTIESIPNWEYDNIRAVL